MLFRVPPQRKRNIGIISIDRGYHAVRPQRPLHLPGYVAINHLRTSSPSALELLRAETTASTSPVEAHLQAATVEELPENRDIGELLACQPADSGPRQCPLRIHPRLCQWKLA
jgi:hypothetical protein